MQPLNRSTAQPLNRSFERATRSCALVYVVSLFTLSSMAQQYVNKEWVKTSGLPDAVDWNASVFDAVGNIIVVGNTLTAPGNPDILVTKYNRDGDLLWQQSYGGPIGAQDYGVAVAADQSGNCYVAGVLTTQTNLQDVVVLKYNSTGALIWSQTWNGNANWIDAPSSIALATDGSVYVAGSSYASPQNPDYLLLKYTNSGAFLWAATYDHVGLIDVATSVVVNGTVPVVTGGSAATVDSWDYATVKYNPNTGAQDDEVRVNVPGLGLDNALAFTRDFNGNLFLTGYREQDGAQDIQTVKINTAFTVDWVKTFDGEGLNDIGRAVDTDNAGNTYICGSTSAIGGGKHFITIKYNADGAEVWQRLYKATEAGWVAEANQIACTNDGGVIVVGSIFDGSSYNFKTLKYDAQGKLEWEKEYDGLAGGDDKALGLLVDAEGKVYVSGVSTDGPVNTYTTVKYAAAQLEDGNILGPDGEPFAKANELIVKFRAQFVNEDFAAERDKQFGTLEDVLTAEASEAIVAALNLPSGSGKGINAFKIYRNLTSKDSISITRGGNEAVIPKLWATLLIQVDLSSTPQAVIDAVSAASPYVEYAQLNYLYHPMDPLYPNHQQSLTPWNFYEDASIEVEPAWAITTGRPQVKVGVVDQIIEYWHPDFDMGNTGNSKVVDGYDYFLYQPMNQSYGPNYIQPQPHGTACAGVIGAIRNNDEGIMGIAGGDAYMDEYGSSLISLGIYGDTYGYAASNIVTEAILDGAVDMGGFYNDFGCNVLNNSYGAGNFINEYNDINLGKAILTAFKNECVFVVAQGNGQLPPIFPAGFWFQYAMVSAAASGPDGSLLTIANGGHTVNGGGDIIAPGSEYMVTSTVSANQYFPDLGPCGSFGPHYACFGGSSSAAAHTSGVAALMMSEHNILGGYANDLAPEDVEIILEKSAVDIVGTPNHNPQYTVGYDAANGWGRLNAAEAVEYVHTPYRVFHSGGPDTSPVVDLPTETIVIPANPGWNNTYELPPGTYQAVPRQFTNTYTNDFGPNTVVLDGLGGQPGYWSRPSTTLGAVNFFDEPGAVWEFTLTGNVLHVVAVTKTWHVIQGPNGQTMDQWWPTNPSKVRTPYSVHVRDNFSVGEIEITTTNGLWVVPNPATDRVMAQWSNLDASSIEVYDARGRIVFRKNQLRTEQRSLEFPAQNWDQGLYTVCLRTANDRVTQRFIKQ